MTKHRNTGGQAAGGRRANPSVARADAAPAVAPVASPSTPAASGHQAPASDAGTPGARLRAARTGQRLAIADCAHALHLPVKVLQELEADDFSKADDFIFQRGALQGYARLLGLSPASFEESLRAIAPAAQPALVAVARTSRTHWLLQRYGTAATYIVLTAMIAVPLVLLGLRGGLHRPDARIVSLDQPATSGTVAHAPAPAARTASSAAEPAPDTTPFRASLAPFSAMGFGDLTTGPATATSVASTAGSTVPGDGAHTLTISASTDCWYEITDAEGGKIDSGMLHAGDNRTWHADGPVHVTLGNAGGVTVTEDGTPYPLESSQHANVARFDLFGTAAGSEQD